jgi:hypothetical protein
MKKILIFASAVCLTAGIFAQTPVLQVSDKSATYPVSITADINSDFTWTKDNSTVVSNVFGSPTTTNATLSSQGITISAGANDLDETTITVSAANSAATSCVAVTKQLIVRYVVTPSYVATIGTTTQAVCQNGVVANITVNLTAAVGGSTINSFTYYIDANNSGTQDPSETSQTVVVGGVVAPTTGTISLAAFPTAGVQAIRVTSVNGTSGATTLSSAVTTNNVQTITINALPVLGNFSF